MQTLNRFDWLEISEAPLEVTSTLLNQQLNIEVAGAGYVPNIEERLTALSKSMPLILQREPWNPYDTHAIVVLCPEGYKLGYVPRDQNSALAFYLDCGGKADVTLICIRGLHTGWPRIELCIRW